MLGFLSLVSPANAAVTALDDGNAVLQNCTSENPFSKGMCSGLITG